MQASKQIEIAGKPALVGCTKGVLGLDGGTFILFQDEKTTGEKYVWGYHVADIHIQPKKKYIGVVWGKISISSPDLKPLQDYYDTQTGKCLFVEDRSEEGVEMISDSKSFQEVAPGIMWISYDAFFDLKIDAAGNMLLGIALEKLCDLHLKIGKILKYTQTGLLFIQPVKFDLDFAERETEESPYLLTILPVHGIAPFEYSSDGVNYGNSPELIYSEVENKKVYVRDSAGTVAEAFIKPENWHVTTVPQTV